MKKERKKSEMALEPEQQANGKRSLEKARGRLLRLHCPRYLFTLSLSLAFCLLCSFGSLRSRLLLFSVCSCSLAPLSFSRFVLVLSRSLRYLRSLRSLGFLLGALGCLFGALGRFLGALGSLFGALRCLLGAFWVLLGPSWVPLGASWGLFGRSCASWGDLGISGRIF